MKFKEWLAFLVLAYLIFGALGCEQFFWLILVFVGLFFGLKIMGIGLFCVLSIILISLGWEAPKTKEKKEEKNGRKS